MLHPSLSSVLPGWMLENRNNKKGFNLKCVPEVDALVVVKLPVGGDDRVCTENLPSHDDVGGSHVVHVEADQREIVHVARDGELSVQDDVGLHGLDIGLLELRLPFDN